MLSLNPTLKLPMLMGIMCTTSSAMLKTAREKENYLVKFDVTLTLQIESPQVLCINMQKFSGEKIM